jgi:hypothetical protein
VVQAAITLFMSASDFSDPTVRAAFLAAVASSAKTNPNNVNIVSIKDTLTGQTVAGRRLLQAETRMAMGTPTPPPEEDDATLHVFMLIKDATELKDLDRNLFSEGLEPSLDHVFFAPHEVVATPN